MEQESTRALGVCLVCNTWTNVLTPSAGSAYRFALCAACGQMPRGQILMAAYLCEIRNMILALGDQYVRHLRTMEQAKMGAEENL